MTPFFGAADIETSLHSPPLLCGSRMFSSALQVGDTALHMASLKGHEEVVRLLLQSGVKDVTNKVCSA